MNNEEVWIITSVPPHKSKDCIVNFKLWNDVGVNIYTINSFNESLVIDKEFENLIISEKDLSSLYKRPLISVNEALMRISEIAPKDSVIGIVNSDVIPNANLDWHKIASSINNDEIMIHKRTDFKSIAGSAEVEFKPSSYEYGYDLFLLRNNDKIKGFISDTSGDLAYGVPWWDYWFPFKGLFHGYKINSYENCSIFHEIHQEQFSQKLWHCKGEEFRKYLKDNHKNLDGLNIKSLFLDSGLIELCQSSVKYLDSLKYIYNESSAFFNDGVSIVTACMNRNENLVKAIKTWVDSEEIDEIVVVDWSSKEPVRTTLDVNEVHDERIVVIRKEGEHSWNLCRAYNLGFSKVKFSKVLKLDADVCINYLFFKHHVLSENIYFSGSWITAKNDSEKRLNGSFYSNTDLVYKVGGYNEVIDTYGWDDSDLYSRFKKLANQVDFDTAHISHIHQTEESRIENSKRNMIFDSLPVPVFTELEIKKNQWKSYMFPPILPMIKKDYGYPLDMDESFFYRKSTIFFLNKKYSEIGLNLKTDLLECLSLNALHDLFVFRHSPVSWKSNLENVYKAMAHIPFTTNDNFNLLTHDSSPYLDSGMADIFPEFVSNEFTSKITLKTSCINDIGFFKDAIKEKSYTKKITVPIVIFHADIYVDDLIENINEQILFKECLFVFVIADKKPYPSIEKFCDDNPSNSVYIYLMHDPGLYDCWNYVASSTMSCYISNWNSDDRRSPEHLAKLASFLDSQPTYAAVSSALFVSRTINKSFDQCFYDGDEKWFSECSRKFNHTDMFQKQWWLDESNPERDNIISQNFLHCMPLWRSSLHHKYGFFNESKYGASADWEFWLRCGLNGESFFQVDEPLGVYLLNENSYGRATAGVLEKEEVIKNEYLKYSNIIKD